MGEHWPNWAHGPHGTPGTPWGPHGTWGAQGSPLDPPVPYFPIVEQQLNFGRVVRSLMVLRVSLSLSSSSFASSLSSR